MSTIFDKFSMEEIKKDHIVFLHVADTHNGASGNASRYNEYSALRIEKTNDKGINIRQDDIDQAFAQTIDIAIEHKVDFFVHAGDGTDSWGYKQPYVYNTYLKQVTRLNEHNIKYVEIIGNHNLPKKSGVGCYLESLGRYPGIYTSYKGFYEQIPFPENGIVFHCVPSTFTQEVLNESLLECRPLENVVNVGIGHFGVTTIKHYAENSEKTLVATLDQLHDCKMDYFALGDYHAATDFGNNIRYSGSIERLGFGEAENEPQVLVVAIHKNTKQVHVKKVYLNVRPMIDLKPIDASDKSIERVNELIIERLTSKLLDDAIVRLRISKLPKHYKESLVVDKIKELTERTLYFKLELKDKTENSASTRTSSQIKFVGPLEGWDDFMNAVEDDGTFDKNKIRKMGYDRLVDAYEMS